MEINKAGSKVSSEPHPGQKISFRLLDEQTSWQKPMKCASFLEENVLQSTEIK